MEWMVFVDICVDGLQDVIVGFAVAADALVVAVDREDEVAVDTFAAANGNEDSDRKCCCGLFGGDSVWLTIGLVEL